MSSKHTLSLLALAALSALTTAPALAQEGSYYYGGLSVGASRARIDQERITAGLLANGLNTTGFTADNRDKGYKLFGGYQINRHFGVELGYFNLGRFGFVANTQPAGTLSGQIKLQGVNLDLVGTLPITERLSAIARIGVQSAQARDHFAATGAVGVLNPDPKKRDTNAKVGVGVQYEIGRSLLLRGEAERYRINDAVGNRGDVNLISVSLVVPFGRAPEVAPRMAAAPAYVAPPPAPAPAPAPVVTPPPAPAPQVVQAPPAPPPERRRVSFTAESLFAFDQALIGPEGRAALDRFAAETRATRYDVVVVEGHTDRLGSERYNQDLSARRAQAVKDYLVNPGAIEAGKINAAGKGESQPITAPGQCKGNRANPRLIACLQPDRRVVIEVTGTR